MYHIDEHKPKTIFVIVSKTLSTISINLIAVVLKNNFLTRLRILAVFVASILDPSCISSIHLNNFLHKPGAHSTRFSVTEDFNKSARANEQLILTRKLRLVKFSVISFNISVWYCSNCEKKKKPFSKYDYLSKDIIKSIIRSLTAFVVEGTKAFQILIKLC